MAINAISGYKEDDELHYLSKEDQRLVADFLTDEERFNSEETARKKRIALRPFVAFLEGREIATLEEVAPSDFKKYIARSIRDDYAPPTIKTRFGAVSTLYTWLVNEDELPEGFDIKDRITRRQREYMTGRTRKEENIPEEYYLTAGEVNELIENVPSPKLRNRLVIKLLFHCGLRRGECATIKLDNIHRDDRSITVTNLKAGKNQPLTRKAYYGQEIETLLTAWINGGDRNALYMADSSEYLFPTHKTEHLSGNRINWVVKTAADSAGLQGKIGYTDKGGNEKLKITAHTLRHSFAVHCVRSDTGEGSMDIKTLADLMGHADISTTQKYLRFRDERRKDAANRFGPGSGK